MKRRVPLISIVATVVVLGVLFRVQVIKAVTGVAGKTITIVNPAGANIVTGTESATAGVASETVNVVDANGLIMNALGAGGGGTTITSGAGDFGAATSQAGAVLTGTVVSVQSAATGTTATAGDSSTKLATTAFVANIAAGINPAVAVQEATAAVLPQAPAYLNGASGIGATLISTSFSALVVDGVTASVGDRVLVKNQASAFQNGVYVVTVAGSGAAFYTLTRALDYDQPSDMNNTGAIPVISGTANAGTSWVQSSQVTTVGTDAVTFTQFSYALANQASISGNNSFTGTNTFLTHPIAPASGGIGLGTGAPAWGRTYGTGAEGAHTTGSENLGGVHNYTTFNCTGTISTAGVPAYLVIYATTSITLGAACSIPFTNFTNGSAGTMGGAGGSGGGGTAGGSVGFGTGPIGSVVVASYLTAPAGGASSGGAGNNGTANPNYVSQMLIANGPAGWLVNGSSCGGGSGGNGGTGAAARGKGGSCIFLIAPLITIANGALLDTSGGPGTSATANSNGGGGGGGGGAIVLAYQTLADSSAATYYKMGGGAPGACTGPAIQLANAPGDSTGIGANIVVTGLTTGGIDATKVTVTGGSGYTIAPLCTVVANGSGITGSPTCTTTINAGAVTAIVVGAAGSGGTFTAFTTCGIGGAGAPGLFAALQAQ